jgi:hypothetical protein
VGIYDVTLARQITLVLSNGCSVSLLPILRWHRYLGGAFRSVRYYSFTSFVIHHILATSTLPHTRRVVRGVIALRSFFVRSLSVTEAPPLYVNALYTISPILPTSERFVADIRRLRLSVTSTTSRPSSFRSRSVRTLVFRKSVYAYERFYPRM